jgi:aspartate aminotransferase
LLNDCPGLACPIPDGTFNLLVSCAGVIGQRMPDGRRIATDRDFAAYLLEAADIVALPGADCGLSPFIRISLAHPMDVLTKAARRIARAAAALDR